MTIEHVALYVSGLEAARDFFVQYFDAEAGAEYRNERTGFRSYFCRLKAARGLRLCRLRTFPTAEQKADGLGTPT